MINIITNANRKLIAEGPMFEKDEEQCQSSSSSSSKKKDNNNNNNNNNNNEGYRLKYILLFTDLLICATKVGEHLHLDWKSDFYSSKLEIYLHPLPPHTNNNNTNNNTTNNNNNTNNNTNNNNNNTNNNTNNNNNNNTVSNNNNGSGSGSGGYDSYFCITDIRKTPNSSSLIVRFLSFPLLLFLYYYYYY